MRKSTVGLPQKPQDSPENPVYGFLEKVSPGHPDYRGWGAVLIRPYGDSYTIYQAPHVKADVYTEDITLDAFVDDENARIAIFAGTHRNANDDGDGDGEPDSDVAHDTENLFHALTIFLANKGLTDSKLYWFIQMHGATDRTSEPTIVGSDGADIPTPTSNSPLAQIDDAVDDAGYVTMGVCGWPEGPNDDEDGDYLLCVRPLMSKATFWKVWAYVKPLCTLKSSGLCAMIILQRAALVTMEFSVY